MDIVAKSEKSKFCIFEKHFKYFSRTSVQALDFVFLICEVEVVSFDMLFLTIENM
jgi:hypothetical protein